MVAWMFYRRSDWRFPIGLFEGYSYPETVSIGLTGAIPLLAVPLKVFDSILPVDFQYFGIWLLLCFVLQAFFAYRLLTALDVKDSVVKSLGACLFVLSYSMLDRIGHLNLCGHWLILAALYGYFQWNNPWKALGYHCLLVALSVWVHPYLIIFNLVIGGAHFLNLLFKQKVKWYFFLSSLVLLILSAVLAWMILGNHHLDTDQAIAEGFGVFSANLNTFFTPKIDTLISSAQEIYSYGQFEGVAYLGLGILGSMILYPYWLVTGRVQKKWNRDLGVILLVAISLFIFALSHKVSLNEYLLFEYKLPSKVLEYLSIFRASGRYVWLLQYLLIMLFVLLIGRLDMKQQWKYLILVLAIAVNTIDFYDVIKRNKYIDSYHPSVKVFHQELWSDIICQADRFRMYPAYQQSYNSHEDQMEFAFIAGQCGQPINVGHLARYDSKLRSKMQVELKDSLMNPDLVMDLSSYTLLTSKGHIADFSKLVEASGHELFELDQYFVFVPVHQNELIQRLKMVSERAEHHILREDFEAFAKRNRGNTMLFSVKDEASRKLGSCEGIQNWVATYESDLVNLEYRESYAAIFGGSQIITEMRAVNSQDQATVRIDMTMLFGENERKVEKTIEIFSAGNDNGNKASIFVEGTDYSNNDRGLNIVILDPSGHVIESTTFDTYESCHHFSELSKLYFELWKIN